MKKKSPPTPALPVLTPAQRERQPLLAAVLACCRTPEPGEEVIDMRPTKTRKKTARARR